MATEEKVVAGCFGTFILGTVICMSVPILALPIADIVIGARYLNDCPIEPKIPIWLIVHGSTTILVVLIIDILMIVAVMIGLSAAMGRVRSKLSKTSKVALIILIPLCILIVAFILILSLFSIAWFIVGNVWVFSNFSAVQYTDSSKPSTYCNQILYWYSFCSIIVFYVLSFLSCCCGCLSSMFTTCLGCAAKSK